MHASSHAAHPFGLLADPDAIARALEGSQRLECLNRRVCRPLDRQTPVKPQGADSESFGALVDRESGQDTDH